MKLSCSGRDDAACVHSSCNGSLLDRGRAFLERLDGLDEVPGVVDVEAARGGVAVGEQLQGDDLAKGGDGLGGGFEGDEGGGELAHGGVVPVGQGEDGRAEVVELAGECEHGLVAADGAGVGAIDRGENDERRLGTDEGGGTVAKFAGGVGFGVGVGAFFEFERAFAGNGKVEAAAAKEKAAGVLKMLGKILRGGLPGWQLAGDAGRRLVQLREALGNLVGGERLLGLGGEQAEQDHGEQLGGEAFRRGDGVLGAGKERHGDISFAHHGGGRDVGDGEYRLTGGPGAAQSKEGVRGLARLRDDDHAGGALGRGRAEAVFAGVFDVHREAGDVFEEDLACEARVTAGAAGGNQQLRLGAQPMADGIGGVAAEAAALDVVLQGAAEGFGLLVDLGEHPVREARGR